MVSQEHIDSFSPTLLKILNNEINLGNEIIETSKSWPKKESVVIILKLPFIQDYKIEAVEYREINDIHYWKAEYFHSDTNHTLACKF
jgi:hypothetical protein